MITCDIIDQGSIDTTLPDTSDPSYQSAALCLFLRQQFAALRTATFQFQKAQVSDLSTYSTSLTDWLEDAQAREDEIIVNGVTEIVANLPDILSIGAAYMSGGASAALGCVANIALDRLLGGGQGALAAHQQATAEVDLTELIEKLDEIRDAVYTILTEHTINIYSDKEDVTFQYGKGDFPE